MCIRQTHSSYIPKWTPAGRRIGLLFCGAVYVLFLLLGLPAVAQTSLTPSTLSFGNESVGQTSGPRVATFKNTQTVPLTISSIVTAGGTSPADYAWGGTCPISPNTLGPGSSCSISVTFTPSDQGSRTTSLTVTDSASNSPQSIALAGTGIPVTLSANNRQFISRLLGTTSGVQTVTLTNHLNTELPFSAITASGDFSVASNTCGSSIGAGLNCTIGVTFTPTALGLRQGTLTISYSAFGSPSLVALSGTGNDTGLTAITVTPANTSMATGTAQQFTAIGLFSSGSTQNLTPFVTWSSSALGVAPITAGGLATGATVGNSGISATIGSITGSTTLTVTTPTAVLTSIAVTPANSSIVSGSTQQFTATGSYSDGSTQNLTSTATWSSLSLSVATISNASALQGLASGLAPGSATIQATAGAISGSTSLTVSAATLAPIVAPPWLQFLGDGSDGAYSCTSGTCILGGEYWVSSFEVSAGAIVVGAGQNSDIVIRSTGACTVAGTMSNSPNSGPGVTITGNGDFGGGGGGGGGGGAAAGSTGMPGLGDGAISMIAGGPPGTVQGGNGGDGGTPINSQYRMLLSGGTFFPTGGSVGGAGGGSGGAGGWGAGAMILMCNSIDFTGTIDVSGGPGGASPANNSGAGGGGGGGYVIFSAVTFTANTGTINTAGGVGGSCNSYSGCGVGGNGGNGWNVALTIP